MFENLKRALDLAARYDYDYWLRQEVSTHASLFAADEVQELLPAELRGAPVPAPAAAPAITTATVATPAPLVDLTINMLGSIEIFRDRARPFAADAWTTRRSRDILCFIASRPHHRAPKDNIVDTFWRDVDVKTVERNFHPTMSHIRKALNIVGNGDISAKDFVNREEPLTNLLEVMRHLMSHNGHLKTAILP